MKAKGKQAQPAADDRQLPRALGCQLGVPQGADGVCQQDLLGKTHAEAAGAQRKILRGIDAAVQILRHGFVLDDRPRNELGEHGDKGAEVHNVPLDRRIPTVDVDGIAHGLEGKEGNTDGQGNPQLRYLDAGKQGKIGGQEVPVFEKPQEQQVEHHRLPHEPPGFFVVLPVLFHQQAVDIVNEDGGEHDDDIHRFAPAVEKQADQQKHQVPPPQRRQKIHRKRQRQICK